MKSTYFYVPQPFPFFLFSLQASSWAPAPGQLSRATCNVVHGLRCPPAADLGNLQRAFGVASSASRGEELMCTVQRFLVRLLDGPGSLRAGICFMIRPPLGCLKTASENCPHGSVIFLEGVSFFFFTFACSKGFSLSSPLPLTN